MEKTIIFTDGSSRGNPGSGGWGAIVAYGKDSARKVKELGDANKHTTNNRMELTAVIEALSFAGQKIPSIPIILYTDSQYVKKGATEWVHGWQKNDWKTKAKEEVLNRDLWEKLLPLVSAFDIEIKVIKGHAGVSGNERCDVIATSFADNTEAKLFDGDFSDYKVSLDIKVLHSTGNDSAKSKNSTKGKKAYSYVSSIKGVVTTHKTWAECEARVKGQPNARFKKTFSKSEEEELVKRFSL